MPLTLYFQNINGMQQHGSELSVLLNTQGYDVVSLCETHLADHDHLKSLAVDGLQLYRHEWRFHTSTSCGLGVLLSPSVSYSRLPLLEAAGPHLLCVLLPSSVTAPLVLITCYIPPDARGKDALRALDKCLSDVPQQHPGASVLVVGDFNAHSPEWGCDKDSALGQQLCQLLDKHAHLCVVNNTQNPPKPTRPRSGYVIDLALASSADLVRDFDVLPPFVLSDHDALHGLLSFAQLSPPPVPVPASASVSASASAPAPAPAHASPAGSLPQLQPQPAPAPSSHFDEFDVPVWNWRRADPSEWARALERPLLRWSARHSSTVLRATLGSLDAQTAVDLMWTSLAQCVEQTAHQHIGQTTVRKRAPTWLQADEQRILSALRQCQALRARSLRAHASHYEAQADRLALTQALQHYAQLIRQSKESFTSALAKKVDLRPGQINWAALKRAVPSASATFSIPALERSDGSLSSSRQETVDLLASHFAAVSSGENHPSPHNGPPALGPAPAPAPAPMPAPVPPSALTPKIGANPNPNPNSSPALDSFQQQVRKRLEDFFSHSPTSPQDLEHLPSLQEVERAMFALNPRKSPGPDGLPVWLFQRGGPAMVRALHTLFTLSLRLSVVPQAFRRANVVPIHKVGDEAHLASHYRPISLTSVVAKMLESLVLEKLEDVWACSDMRRRCSQQNGFTSGRGCQHSVFRLRQSLAEFRRQRKESFFSAVFVDLRKAFDTVWLDGLLYQLISLDLFPRILIFWLRAFLQGRELRVVYRGSHSAWLPIHAGVPQGAILSPFLFLIFIHSVCLLEEEVPLLYLSAFADDLSLWSAFFGEEGDAVIQKGLDALVPLLDRLLVQVNPAKTECLRFGDPPANTRALLLRGQPITVKKNVCYLGVHFDREGTFDLHVSKVRSRMQVVTARLLPILRNLNSLMSARLILAQHLIPLFAYCVAAWRPTKSQVQRMQSQLLSAFRQLLHLPACTSQERLMEALGLTPLDRLYRRLFLRFDLSLQCLHKWDAVGHACKRYPKGGSHLHALQTMKQEMGCADQSTADIISSHSLPSFLSYKPLPFVRLEPLAIATLRVRLLLNQSALNADLHKKRLAPSSSCTHCQTVSGVDVAETLAHVVFDCPLYSQARSDLFSSCSPALISCDSVCGQVVPGLDPSQSLQLLRRTRIFLEAFSKLRFC
jgi:hypothetical protein